MNIKSKSKDEDDTTNLFNFATKPAMRPAFRGPAKKIAAGFPLNNNLGFTFQNTMTTANSSLPQTEKALSIEENEEISKQVLEEFLQNEQEFINLLKDFISYGADPTVSIDKLKKYREDPGLLAAEILQDKLVAKALPGVVNQATKKYGKAQRFVVNSFPGFYNQQAPQTAKKRFTEYGDKGLQNLWHLILTSPTPKLMDFVEELKIKFNTIDDKGCSPLHIFISNNSELFMLDNHLLKKNTKVLSDLLLHEGINPELKNLEGDTALNIAARASKFSFVEILCKANASVNTINKNGQVPLIYWVQQKNLKNVELLLNLGADPNFNDNKSRNALHHAVNKANADTDASFEMEALLLQFGAKINNIDKNGRSPLHYAFVKIGEPFVNSMIDPVETVSSLLGVVDCEINIADNWGKTPLHYAAQRGANISGIYLLNRKEVQIDSKDKDGNTALAIAFINKHSNFATLLIQNHANILSTCINVPENHDKNKDQNQNNYGFNVFGGLQQKQAYTEENEEDDYEEDEMIDEEEEEIIGEKPMKKSAKKTKMQLESQSSQSDVSDTDSLTYSTSKQQPIQSSYNYNAYSYNYNNRFGQQQQNQVLEELNHGKTYSYFTAAIKYGWQGVSYLLIQQGYEIMDAIESALAEQKFHLVLTLLTKKSDKLSFQKTNAKKHNLWHLFAIHGKNCTQENIDKICKVFNHKEIDLKGKDHKDRLPFHYSAGHGFTVLSQYFLENKIDPLTPDSQENTPFSLVLQGTSQNIDYFLLDKYLKHGAKLSSLLRFKAEKVKMTPLIYLISRGEKSQKNIKWFLDHGSSINEKDSNGCTPLIYAIKLNSRKLVSFILNHPDLIPSLHKDVNSRTPIHYVVRPLEMGSYENIEILKLLASKGFGVNEKDSMGKEPMFYAMDQDSGKMVNALLELGAVKRIKELPRSKTSIITTIDWIEEELDVEEDANKFIEECKKADTNENQQSLKKQIALPDQYVVNNTSGPLEVLYEGDVPYDLMMTKVDLKTGFYSEFVFYKMQVLYEKNRDVYILFNRWGRIGTEGQYQQTPFSTKEEAVKEFLKIFSQKSGNEWAKKEEFKKVPKKYQLIKTQVRENVREYLTPFDYSKNNWLPSHLDKEILKVMKMFADVKMYQNAMNSFSFNQQNFSLATLDKGLLLEANAVLLEIADLLKQLKDETKDFYKGADAQKVLDINEKIADKSSRFYELMPVDNYTAERVPPISNEYQLNRFLGIVDSLINFEITTKILLGFLVFFIF